MAATQTVFLPAMGATFRRYMPESYYPRAYGVRAMLDAHGGAVRLIESDHGTAFELTFPLTDAAAS